MDINKLFRDSFLHVDHKRVIGSGSGEGDGYGYGYGEACGHGPGFEGGIGGDHGENLVFKEFGYDGIDVSESSFIFNFGNDFESGAGHGSGCGRGTSDDIADGSGSGYRRRS